MSFAQSESLPEPEESYRNPIDEMLPDPEGDYLTPMSLGFDPDGDEFMASIEDDYPIDFGGEIGSSKEERKKQSEIAMEARRRLASEAEGGDWWDDDDDPSVAAVMDDLEVLKIKQFEQQLEKAEDDQDEEFRRIEEAPLRHHKKRR